VKCLNLAPAAQAEKDPTVEGIQLTELGYGAKNDQLIISVIWSLLGCAIRMKELPDS
jgi:hypothetical protein